MGKKRTHAETKDGFAKPPPDTSRTSVKTDKKDKRKNGEQKARSALVCINDT
jgi:ribosome biogenesis protein MAK21